jgi:hypothetical protein
VAHQPPLVAPAGRWRGSRPSPSSPEGAGCRCPGTSGTRSRGTCRCGASAARSSTSRSPSHTRGGGRWPCARRWSGTPPRCGSAPATLPTYRGAHFIPAGVSQHATDCSARFGTGCRCCIAARASTTADTCWVF